MHSDLANYRRDALTPTLCNALRHDYYKSAWHDALEQGSAEIVDDPMRFLSRLPPLGKGTLQTGLPPLLEKNEKIAFAIHTTGSTGPVTYRYRSDAELREIAGFFQQVAETIRGDRRRPLVYMLYGPYHGRDLSGLGGFFPQAAPYYFSGAVWDDIFIRQGIELLRKRFDVPGLDDRISQVHGAVRLLRVFTQCMIDAGVRATETGVETLVSFAGYLASESRNFLQRYWGVMPLEIFSFSEVMGGASKCPMCGALNFDPHLLPEVLSFTSAQAVDEGVGRLVVTELLPFGRSQPLIRYYNGDIVQRVKSLCPVCDQTDRIIHLGRDNESIILSESDNREVIIGSNQLREIAYCSEIARTAEYPHLRALKDRTTHVGAPFVACETIAGMNGGKTEVRLRFRPRQIGGSRSNLEDEVRQRSMQIAPGLGAAVESGKVDFRTHADDSLDSVLWK
ncbi:MULTISPECIES: hypothetical protein [unclassified Variovorax]|uniref:hypothetical protein n=1 Tax=unclassified Variovorax TaxID=663243 RepID=UPI001BD365B0|nr:MULTISPECIES: hypothetical protein [unclassified Variovorax]